MNTKSTLSIKSITVTALMTAVLCVIGPLSLPIPISPVPISLSYLFIYITIYILGGKLGVLSVTLYVLLGAIGLPVFSGYSGGIGKLLGPTGGYIIGYLFIAIILGFFLYIWQTNKVICLIGLLLGTLVCYSIGTLWLAISAGMSFQAALMAGVIPFIPGDMCKILIALFLGPILRNALKKAHLL